MGLPQQPVRLLLPRLRGDRRQGRVRAQHGGRGAEGAGVGRRADLAAPHRPDPASACADLFGRRGWPLAGDPDQQRLRVPRSASSVPKASRTFQVRKSEREHRIRRFLRYLRPVLRPRTEAQSVADMDREAAANRDRQLLALMT